jgi:hypothetical protein
MRRVHPVTGRSGPGERANVPHQSARPSDLVWTHRSSWHCLREAHRIEGDDGRGHDPNDPRSIIDTRTDLENTFVGKLHRRHTVEQEVPLRGDVQRRS